MAADFSGGVEGIDTRTQMLLNHQTVKHQGEHQFPIAVWDSRSSAVSSESVRLSPLVHEDRFGETAATFPHLRHANTRFRYSRLFVAITSAPSSYLNTSTDTLP